MKGNNGDCPAKAAFSEVRDKIVKKIKANKKK